MSGRLFGCRLFAGLLVGKGRGGARAFAWRLVRIGFLPGCAHFSFLALPLLPPSRPSSLLGELSLGVLWVGGVVRVFTSLWFGFGGVLGGVCAFASVLVVSWAVAWWRLERRAQAFAWRFVGLVLLPCWGCWWFSRFCFT